VPVEWWSVSVPLTFPCSARWLVRSINTSKRRRGAIPSTTLERLAQGDKSARFKTRGQYECFGVMNPPNFSKDGVFVEQGDDSRSKFGRRRKLPKSRLGSKVLLGNVITKQRTITKGL
jgi:hypothetical protein